MLSIKIMLRLIKNIHFAHFYTSLVLVILLLHTFYPKTVNVDRFTVTFLVLLFFMLILPTLVSGRISYLFEFKRDLSRLSDSVRKLEKINGTKDKKIKSGVARDIKDGISAKNICFTTGKIILSIENLLKRIAKRHFDEKQLKKLSKISDIVSLLQKKDIISSELAEAIERTVKICTPVGYHSRLSSKDVEDIVNTTLPVIQKLTELSK